MKDWRLRTAWPHKVNKLAPNDILLINLLIQVCLFGRAQGESCVLSLTVMFNSQQNRCLPSRSTFSDTSDDEDNEFLLPKAKYGRFERILQSLTDEVAAVKEQMRYPWRPMQSCHWGDKRHIQVPDMSFCACSATSNCYKVLQECTWLSIMCQNMVFWHRCHDKDMSNMQGRKGLQRNYGSSMLIWVHTSNSKDI